MNVLIVTYLAPTSPSGVVTYCRSLAGDLMGKGFGVHTVDATQTPVGWRKFLGVLKRIMRPLGGIFSALYDEFGYFTGTYLAVRKLHHAQVDLIHAQDVRSGVAAYLALRKRVPVVLTCHFNDDPVREIASQFALKPGFTRRLKAWYTFLFSYIQHYVFVSHYAYMQSRHLLPSSIHKRILHNTVHLSKLDVTTRNENADPARLIISNVGYIDDRKNQQLLLRIAHELRNRGFHNFQLWFIGDGPKREEYTQLAAELDLLAHVTFFGQQAAPWLLVAQSDLYIHTALNDNCPYSIIEAFAVGTPVLALPVGGIPEMLPQGYGALHGANVDELTSEVSVFFELKQRRRLALAQSAHANRVFNPHTNLEKLLAFYQETLGPSTLPIAYPNFA